MARKCQALAAVLVLMMQAASYAQSADKNGAGKAEGTAPVNRMSLERYAEYLKLFNARDDRWVEFYSKDIIFDHGEGYGILQGRQAVLDFYHRAWADVDEEVVPGKIAIDNENGIMMVEITTRLRAKHDNAKLGAFRVFAHQGDLLVVPGVIAYGLADGLITTIAGIDTGESYRPASKARAAPFPNDTAVVTPEVKAQVEKAYREYVACFNQRDLDCITNYFGEDFVFKGPIWTLHGIPEFKAFYINAWRHFNEHLTIKSIEVRPNQIIVDVYNQLSVSNDFPDFAAGPLKKGDNHLVSGPIVYTLKNGRVCHIESETRLSPPPCATGNCASKRAGSGSHDLILKEGNG